MAIAYRDGATAGSTSFVASQGITIPNDLSVGNLVLLYGVATASSGAMGLSFTTSGTTVPTSITSVYDSGVGVVYCIWYFTVQAGDPGATLTMTPSDSSNQYIGIGLLAYSGASVSQPDVYVNGDTGSSTSTTWTAPSTVTATTGDWAIYFAAAGDGPTITGSPGTTRVVDAFSVAGADSAGSVGMAGTTIGGGTWTANGSAPWSGFTIGIKPTGSINVVQTAVSNGFNGAATFASNITAGNTVVLIAANYSTTGGDMSTSSPTLGGSTPAGSSKLEELYSSGSDRVVQAIWLLPDVSAGNDVVAISVSNAAAPAAIIAYEVAGLGTSPVLDKTNQTEAQGTSASSGTSGAITSASELVIGTIIGFASSFTPLGTPWTSVAYTNTDWFIAGYQTTTSSGGSYTYAQSGTDNQDWSAGIVTIAPGGVVSSSPTLGLLIAMFP